jgi:hypothetical protein
MTLTSNLKATLFVHIFNQLVLLHGIVKSGIGYSLLRP